MRIKNPRSEDFFVRRIFFTHDRGYMKDVSKEIYDVIVVGGGASGMMAAGRAAARGKRVLLLEKNHALGEKLKISGGGRCNITNAEEHTATLLKKYGDAEKFLYTSFSQFGVRETFSFFTERGLPLVVEAHKRAFPKSQKALDVFHVLEAELQKWDVDVQFSSVVTKIQTKGNRVISVCVKEKEFFAASFIFATGGISHPETGSTGDGFVWLQNLGLAVQKPTPSLVPIAVKESFVKQLSGVTHDAARITFFVDGKRSFVLRGRVLFTHFGLSGPTILNGSAKVSDALHEGEVTAHIDLCPEKDHGTLDAELVAYIEKNRMKALKNMMKGFLPDGLSDTLLSLVHGLDSSRKAHELKKEERKQLIQRLKAVPITIIGLMGQDMAIVSDGGLSLTEIDMKTMRVKKYDNLFVTGDLLHIRRPSGGFSLQLCWTTGFLAGENC